MKIANVCPFSKALTSASMCMLTFRRNFIKDNQIGIIPKSGYRLADKQSALAIKWLLWLEHSRGIRLKHAGRCREKTISRYLVDGVLDDNNHKLTMQFHGRYLHGHSCAGKDIYQDSGDGTTMRSRRETTEYISQAIRNESYALEEMWECDFRAQIKNRNNVDLRNFINSIDNDSCTETITPREALFGSRTENFEAIHVVSGNEKILYNDVTSLYPYVLKTKIFPVGHPEVYVLDDINQICPNNNTRGKRHSIAKDRQRSTGGDIWR